MLRTCNKIVQFITFGEKFHWLLFVDPQNKMCVICKNLCFFCQLFALSHSELSVSLLYDGELIHTHTHTECSVRFVQPKKKEENFSANFFTENWQQKSNKFAETQFYLFNLKNLCKKFGDFVSKNKCKIINNFFFFCFRRE